mgnify:CR=1 FL=1
MAVQIGLKRDGTTGVLDAGDIMAANQSAVATANQIGSVAVEPVGLAQTVGYNGNVYGMDPESIKLMQNDAEAEGMKGLPDSTTDTSKDLLGMNPDQWGSAMKMGQIGIGAGQLGLGLASYFQNKGLADKQKELLGQQIESNRSEIDARKNYRSALEGFGSQSQPTRI